MRRRCKTNDNCVNSKTGWNSVMVVVWMNIILPSGISPSSTILPP